MRATIVLVVVVAVILVSVFAFSSPKSQVPAAASISTTDVTKSAAGNGADLPFVQGGTIAMELEGADYKVTPSGNDHITISYGTNPFNTQLTKIAAGVKGSEANVRIQTPSGNGIHVEIGIPAKTNLYTRMTAGNLTVEGIEGSKDLELRAGNMTIDVVDAKQYGPVYASVSSGDLAADAWSVNKGGILRSFKTNGSGKYGLHAHVSAGKLTLTERSGMK